MSASARSRALAAAAAVVVVGVALVLALGGGGQEGPAAPPDEAARLVPAGALAYVHLATDARRPGVARAERLAARFPGWPALRKQLLARLSAPGCGVTAAALRGGEAALAVLPDSGAGPPAAQTLVLLDTGREGPAQHRTCGATASRRIGRFLAVGSEATLRVAAALAAGKGPSLASDALYRKAREGLPGDRVLDGFFTVAALRTLLAPQGGLTGAAGALLDRPGLRGGAFAATATARGARLTVHGVVDPKAAGGRYEAFAPTLDALAPAGALLFVDARGLGLALRRLLGLAGSASEGLGALLTRLRAELRRAGGGLEGRLTKLFSGETSLTITRADPAPRLTVVATVTDEAAARRTLADLQAPLAALLAPPAQGGGVAPTFDQVTVGGVEAFQLRAGGGLELDYAVFDGHAVLSTNLSGIAAVKLAGRRLTESAVYQGVLGERPKRVGSLLFLDFRQLLALGEQTGLTGNRAYQQVRRDLSRVRTVGGTTSGDADQFTLQIELEIP